MFGYIRPLERELKIREAEYYRALYCGVCVAEGRMCGQAARLTLSYDAVFIALLRAAVTGKQPETEKMRCPRHPFCRRTVTAADEASDAAAASCVLLAYGKLCDDAADERGLRRFGAGTARLFLGGAEKRARAASLDSADGVTAALAALAEFEAGDSSSIDTPAAICGRMTGDAAAAGLSGDEKRIVHAAASAVGRWLYCVDAADDLAEDVKKGRFNPIFRLYGKDRLTPDEALTFSCAVSAHIDAALAALDLVPRAAHESAPEAWAICENILTLGMPAAAAQAIEKITDGSAARAAGKES